MRALTIALMALGLVAAAVWFLREDTPQAVGPGRSLAVPVTAWTVAPQSFQSRVKALGTLLAWESVVITASVSETVATVHFTDGQYVEKGTLLVTLQQEQEQASLREQQEMLREHEREVRRLENLVRSNQVAQTELDQRRTLAAVARNRIEQEKAKIADRTIRAPFSGVLGLREVSPGALVTPGEEITTLDDISRMRLDFTVPAIHLAFLHTGQSIEASTPAYPQPFNGAIVALNSRVDPVNRSITARASFDNPDGLLKPGMLMTVVILGPVRETLLVPEEALVSVGAEHFLWLILGDTAERRVVATGDRRPGWVEINDGIAAGDRVVRDGVARLRGRRSDVTLVEN